MNQPIQPNLVPLQDSERIVSLDVMRGIVLFGILLMNINGFGLPRAYGDPTVAGGFTGLNLYTWITTNMFFEGTMRGLFSLLFGVGMFIFLERLEKRGAGIRGADIFFRRLTWMLLFGLIHGYLLLWTGEILYSYALMGFLLYSFRHLAPKKLVIIALVLFSIGAAWNYGEYRSNITLVENVALAKTYKAEGKTLTKELKEADLKWSKIQEDRSPEELADYVQSMHQDYFSLVAFLAPKNLKTDTYWTYRWDPFDVLSMMLLGIALYKRRVLTAERSKRFYTLMVLLGYAIGLTVNYYELKIIMDGSFDFLSFQKSNLTYDLGRVAISMGHVGSIMLFCKSGALLWLKKRLAAVGKMALTNYIMHSLICMVVFTGVGFKLFGQLERYQLLYVVFSIWALQLIISPIWLKYYQYGPLEWMWRNLSYQKKQPIRIRKNKPELSSVTVDSEAHKPMDVV
jgi:uncharacterized protein